MTDPRSDPEPSPVGGEIRADAPRKSAPLLFLGHAADRTGPPIYLLHVLRWLRATHPEVEFEVALLMGGELEDDFHELAFTTVGENLPVPPWSDAQREAVQDQLRDQMSQHADSRVVHINGAPCAEMARLLPPAERVLLSHVHELEIGLSHWMHPRDRRVLLEDADRIFVVADAVGRNLVENHGVDPAVLALHPGMIDRRSIPEPPPPEERGEARRVRGIPWDGLVIGTSGTVYWRKAFDLFLQAAWRLDRRHRGERLSFVWVGGEQGAIDHAMRLARSLGVEDMVYFVGNQPDPFNWFELMDVFVLPAREDPFPLVCLEALAVGVPVVAFDTGGMPELLDRGCGLVARYPDLHDLTGKIDALLVDPARRHALGERGRELVTTDYDVSHLAPRLWADIERWLP